MTLVQLETHLVYRLGNATDLGRGSCVRLLLACESDLVTTNAPDILRSLVLPKDAHYDPAGAHKQHAIIRHRVAITLGLRHAGGDLVGHRAQLNPRRHLDPDIPVEGGGRLILNRGGRGLK